jgi:hypothetical protein|tara:strand:- start:318 stop:596 length:279 start_codon:yes stop_codon:yes gene_type:complete
MEIKLNSWDINDAIEEYLEKKYSLKININDLEDYLYLEHDELEYEYEKHKNGKVKKDKDGCRIIKDEKYVTKHVCLDNVCSISFYVDTFNEE